MYAAASSKTYQMLNTGPVYRDKPDLALNVIDFSLYKQLHTRFSSRSFSIKYVERGAERYTLNGRNYVIENGRYLLTNAYTSGEVVIDSSQFVKGVCIELSPGIIAEVLATFNDPGAPYPQSDFFEFLTTANFFEHDYDAAKTNLGTYIRRSLGNNSGAHWNDNLFIEQFFYGLAENIVIDQAEIHRYLQSFDSIKMSTRRDLLGRLLKGKEMMDDNFADKMSVADIARVAHMSEYYFLRLFAKTFNCSPHRYLVEKRLQKASDLLLRDCDSVAEIAYKCGFTDIHAFSKSYKKRFGKSPSKV